MNEDVDSSLNKLIILFFLEQLDCAMPRNTVSEICSAKGWLTYIDSSIYIQKLLSDGFIYSTDKDNKTEGNIVITADGRESLANFYINIPTSLREEITGYVKENRNRLRIRQECRSDYYKNKDGTYTVVLTIAGPVQPLMELKFVINDKHTAQSIHRKWEEKAVDIYSVLYDNLID